MGNRTCFILGLPSAGKTSYLAALIASMELHQVNTKLHWDYYTQDHHYLTNLSQQWLSGEKVGRTNPDIQQKENSLQLHDDDGMVYDLKFPDLSGETFQTQYGMREIEQEIAEQMKNCDGILLFIGPQNVIEPDLIIELPDMESLEGEEEVPPGKRNSDTDVTAVQLVTLLQDIEHLHTNSHTAIPLAVVVSAWDILQTSGINPQTYVENHLSLLWQYLETNKNMFLPVYYGVSAQGGELDTEKDVEELLERYSDKPIERIMVVDQSGTLSHDITLPLWDVMKRSTEI